MTAAVTVTLAISFARTAKRPAIIRKMPAEETLGSTPVICSDKTGRLTQDQMSSVRCFESLHPGRNENYLPTW